MTTTEVNPTHIFDDARRMHEAALARIADNDIRDAAEKAWCATLRATEALVFSRTGKLPPRSPDTSRGLRRLAAADPQTRSLHDRYFTRQALLHGECFYTGLCDPTDETERLIHETADFICDAETLAQE